MYLDVPLIHLYYLGEYELERLIKKYSDYVHYAIKMDVTVSRQKEGSEEYEDVIENNCT